MVNTLVESNFRWEINELFFSKTITNSRNCEIMLYLLVFEIVAYKKYIIDKQILNVFSTRSNYDSVQLYFPKQLD